MGPTFDAQKRLGRPKVPPRGATPEIKSSFGPIWGSFFDYFLICWYLFLSIFFVEFRDRFLMDLCIISTLCFGMFSYLSAPLVLVIFCNPSIRKHVFYKSDGSKIKAFSTCFVGFVPSLFFLRFSLIFDAIWGSI